MRRLAPAPLAFALLALAMPLAACGADGAALTGTWQPASEADAPAAAGRYTFFADGRARLVALAPGDDVQAYDARYTVEGDSLLTLSDAHGSERFRMRLAGDTLWLQSPATGQATRLERLRAE